MLFNMRFVHQVLAVLTLVSDKRFVTIFLPSFERLLAGPVIDFEQGQMTRCMTICGDWGKK